MKYIMIFGPLLIAVILASLCGCASAPHRKAQNQQTDEFQSVDSVINDRSKWVDPVLR
jgi:hypothetical protein